MSLRNHPTIRVNCREQWLESDERLRRCIHLGWMTAVPGPRRTELRDSDIRRAALGDESILREVRLQALSEAPEAFGSTYERELSRTPADWRRWLSPGVTFILITPEGVRGMVAGQPDERDPDVVHLMAMWVHPSIRGSGGADALVSAVLNWAKLQRASSVRLNVMQQNHRARRFYERCGFVPTGVESIRARDGLIELQMRHLFQPGNLSAS
jgi:GNAT superfamily N-acetyltransferase